MKKLFTLVAMALMAVGANAQKVIAEIDWSTQEAFNNWCSGENGSTAVVGAELRVRRLLTTPMLLHSLKRMVSTRWSSPLSTLLVTFR